MCVCVREGEREEVCVHTQWVVQKEREREREREYVRTSKTKTGRERKYACVASEKKSKCVFMLHYKVVKTHTMTPPCTLYSRKRAI